MSASQGPVWSRVHDAFPGTASGCHENDSGRPHWETGLCSCPTVLLVPAGQGFLAAGPGIGRRLFPHGPFEPLHRFVGNVLWTTHRRELFLPPDDPFLVLSR